MTSRQALVAHICNPSYLGGWNWENCSLRPAQANSSQDPISKITRAKWTGDVAQAVDHLLCKCESMSPNSRLTKIHIYFQLCAVAYIYNSSYSGGRDQEDHSLRTVWAKKVSETETASHLIKAGCGGTCWHSSYMGSINTRLTWA
jgi:hypothetical protein